MLTEPKAILDEALNVLGMFKIKINPVPVLWYQARF
jgi:hypothetical protein